MVHVFVSHDVPGGGRVLIGRPRSQGARGPATPELIPLVTPLVPGRDEGEALLWGESW